MKKIKEEKRKISLEEFCNNCGKIKSDRCNIEKCLKYAKKGIMGKYIEVVYTEEELEKFKKKFTSNHLRKKIGKYVKKLRKKKDLYQEDLAKELNINRQTLSRIESGDNEFLNLRYIEDIFDYLGYKFDFIIKKKGG